jgi:hypothetical protein
LSLVSSAHVAEGEGRGPTSSLSATLH